VSRYLKGKTNLDFTEARDSEWQWHQLGYMQVCTSLQTDNHTSTPPLSFLQVGCPSCRPTNSVKALKATTGLYKHYINHNQTLFTLTFRSLPETFVKKKMYNSSSGSCHGSDVTWQEIGRTRGSVHSCRPSFRMSTASLIYLYLCQTPYPGLQILTSCRGLHDQSKLIYSVQSNWIDADFL